MQTYLHVPTVPKEVDIRGYQVLRYCIGSILYRT